MQIMKYISDKAENLREGKVPTIAFLGDSVTQGCFELYMKNENEIETVFDKNSAYHNYIAKIFTVLFPNVPINIINAGISGDSAAGGLKRLERDVLVHNPDLTVVSFGLNDCGGGLDKIDKYTQALEQIFEKLNRAGSEIIFMTANMMNTKISCHIHGEKFLQIAETSMKSQNDGVLEAYFEAGKKVAIEHGAKVCDVYAKWKQMAKNGVDTTELLANRINHPCREMNWLFAYSLVETMMSETELNSNERGVI